MNKNYLSILVIMGVLISGAIPGQQLAFADSDELKVEIKIKNGIAEIEVEFEDDEYEFQLATSDIDEILEATSLRTGISVYLLEEAMKLEEKEEDDNHDDERDEDDDSDGREDNNSDEIKSETFEKKLRASTLGNSSEIRIELEFIIDTINSDLLIDEILENFVVTKEEAEGALKIQPEDDDELEDKFTVEIDFEDGISEVEVELRYILDSTDRDEIIVSIVEQSQLDRDLLTDVIEFENETDDSDLDEFLDDSEIQELMDENNQLRKENQLLREENNDLKDQLANLNQVLMEQIRVILDTLAALRS